MVQNVALKSAYSTGKNWPRRHHTNLDDIGSSLVPFAGDKRGTPALKPRANSTDTAAAMQELSHTQRKVNVDDMGHLYGKK